MLGQIGSPGRLITLWVSQNVNRCPYCIASSNLMVSLIYKKLGFKNADFSDDNRKNTFCIDIAYLVLSESPLCINSITTRGPMWKSYPFIIIL